jgi:hypothetical protein
MSELQGPARALLAAVLLMIGGILNIIYGIAAIDKSSFFQQNRHYVFGDLKTWGWVTLIIGILEILASISLFRGGSFGRYFAIAMGSLAAISALLDIPAYPFWSLAIFGLSLWIIYGLTRPGDEAWIEPSASATSMPRQAPRPPM